MAIVPYISVYYMTVLPSHHTLFQPHYSVPFPGSVEEHLGSGVLGNILYLATLGHTNGEIIRDFNRYWSHEDEKQQFSILSSLSLKM